MCGSAEIYMADFCSADWFGSERKKRIDWETLRDQSTRISYI